MNTINTLLDCDEDALQKELQRRGIPSDSDKWKLFTIEEMQQLLDTRADLAASGGPRQRPVSKRKLKHYMRLIAADRWTPQTEDAIQISLEGWLLNGQHRMLAHIALGRKMLSKVRYNVPKEHMKNIDEGSKRTAADVFAIYGIKNASHVAAAVKIFNQVRSGPSEIRNMKLYLSNGETYELFLEHPEIEEWVTYVRQQSAAGRPFHKICEASVTGAVLYTLTFLADRLRVKEFAKGLVGGLELEDRDPRLACRSTFTQMRIKRERGAGARLRKMAFIYRTWNLWVGREKRLTLKWNYANLFPTPRPDRGKRGVSVWDPSLNEKKEEKKDE